MKAVDDPPAEPRRDRWGRYLVIPPGGGPALGYTRATTVAKTLDDGGGLVPWKAALAMTGLLRRPGLRGRWEVLMSAHPETGPWYGGPDSKAAAKKLVEECATAGGSFDRADVGTALHAIVEQINRGETPILHQDSTRADLAAYHAAIAAAGISFDRSLIEAVVVNDTYRVAGTADMLATDLPGHGLVVADLKTGADLRYSWQSIAVQLAIYANADAVYRQGAKPADDGRQPMPVVSREVALVIHLPAGEARCELHLIDIAAGWEAFERSMWTRGWRTRRDLATPFATPGLTPSGDATGERVTGVRETAPVTLDPVDQHAALATRGTPDEGAPADPAAVAALEAAYRALDPAAGTWLRAIVTGAMHGGVSMHLKDNHTVRRFELVRGLVALGLAGTDDDETLRCVLAEIVGDVAHFAALHPGHVLGTLGVDEAARFAALCDELAGGGVSATVDPATGLVRLAFPSAA